MSELDDAVIGRAVAELRRPVALGPGLDARILAAVAAAPAPRAPRGALASAWDWLRRPRSIRLSPLGALAAAALVTLLWWRPWTSAPSPGGPAPSEIQFVYVDPAATSVAVVGDFNDWDPAATPLDRVRSGGLWTVRVALAPGRHRYAFVVDGASWAADPTAPRAAGDDFGTPNSVVTVAGDS